MRECGLLRKQQTQYADELQNGALHRCLSGSSGRVYVTECVTEYVTEYVSVRERSYYASTMSDGKQTHFDSNRMAVRRKR